MPGEARAMNMKFELITAANKPLFDQAYQHEVHFEFISSAFNCNAGSRGQAYELDVH